MLAFDRFHSMLRSQQPVTISDQRSYKHFDILTHIGTSRNSISNVNIIFKIHKFKSSRVQEFLDSFKQNVECNRQCSVIENQRRRKGKQNAKLIEFCIRFDACVGGGGGMQRCLSFLAIIDDLLTNIFDSCQFKKKKKN